MKQIILAIVPVTLFVCATILMLNSQSGVWFLWFFVMGCLLSPVSWTTTKEKRQPPIEGHAGPPPVQFSGRLRVSSPPPPPRKHNDEQGRNRH